MPSLNALSCTSLARDWLTTTQHPVILHIFDRACNLMNEHKEVLSIVTPQIGNGPFNLVLQNGLCVAENIHLDSRLTITAQQLQIGELIIQTKCTQLWNPRPAWETLHTSKASLLSQLPKSLRTRAQSPISNLQSSKSPSSALAIADVPSSVQAARQLAGLGQGLTPAGDDYIMGALYAAWIIHPPEVARSLAKAVTNAAAPLTTSLSAAWLRAAGRGEAGVLWHDFLSASISGDRNQIRSATDKIMATGATSGADALAGFIDTFISYAALERKHVVPKFFR